jgi:hypothetical protein
MAVGLVAVVLTVVWTNVARAGTYVIYDCPAAQSGNFTTGPWRQFGSIPGPGSFKQTCSAPGDSFGVASNGLSSNGTAGEEVHTPASITMLHLKLWWEAPKPISGGGWSYGLIDAYSPGWSRIFQAETPVSADGSSGQNAPTELSLPTNTTQLNVEIYCTTSQNCSYSQNPLKIFGSEITLSDSGFPKGSVIGGGLAGPGPVSGSQSLAYEAQDAGSGVRTVELLVDGKTAAKNDYQTECPYQNLAACPPTVTGLIGWNTTGTTNGTHEVALRITNAGGNSVIVDDHIVTTSNLPIQTNGGSISGAPPSSPPGAIGGGTITHVANGESPCAGETLDLTVNGKTKTPVITYGKTVSVTGVLRCGSIPIRNARVAVGTVGGLATAAISTAVTTGPDGSFIYRVPTGPNRMLRFSYTAYSNDPAPSANATVAIVIAPKIKLKIAPRQTKNRHTIYWSGTITGGPYPRQGITLDMEVREGRHWRIFDQTTANRKGQFRYRYRFHATAKPTTYTFRVAVPNTGSKGYDYNPGASNPIKIRVRE